MFHLPSDNICITFIFYTS